MRFEGTWCHVIHMQSVVCVCVCVCVSISSSNKYLSNTLTFILSPAKFRAEVMITFWLVRPIAHVGDEA
jgi:hypothetical protein